MLFLLMIIMIEMDCMALIHDFRDFFSRCMKGYDILEAQRTLKRRKGQENVGALL
jgi:hypothetical protein